MKVWRELLTRPSSCDDGAGFAAWFDRIAERLLDGATLVIASERLRLVEIEFYYRGPHHPDPFTHGQSIQHECGRWYFHRVHGGYRGGSYKGLDLTFGDGHALGGILIRSLERPDGTIINGPSLCVDYLLQHARKKSVAQLDAAIADRLFWERHNPLKLHWMKSGAGHPIYRSARVGLSIKNLEERPNARAFLMSPYRFLTEPRRVRKGKLHLALSLHAAGIDHDQIHEITGCPRAAINRYIRDHQAGLAAEPLAAKVLSSAYFCRLHGAWHAKRQ